VVEAPESKCENPTDIIVLIFFWFSYKEFVRHIKDQLNKNKKK
jgi:hypothetical protein